MKSSWIKADIEKCGVGSELIKGEWGNLRKTQVSNISNW